MSTAYLKASLSKMLSPTVGLEYHVSKIQYPNLFWPFSTTDDETTKKVAEKLEELSVKEDKTVEEKDKVEEEEKKEDVKAEEKKWEKYELALLILFFSFPPPPFFYNRL